MEATVHIPIVPGNLHTFEQTALLLHPPPACFFVFLYTDRFPNCLQRRLKDEYQVKVLECGSHSGV